MITSLFIANRGEIARRIIRTARRLGVRTIAAYSDADVAALHVREAAAAARLGPAPARESYLRIDAVIEAALAHRAEAIHPGYGFLSENAAFAEACAKAGLIFVGPDPKSIRAMGRKDEAKSIMAAAGVPITPGYMGDDQSEKTLKAEAKRVGYPILIKAVAGGGGKGMRRVDAPEDFSAALASAKREASNAFDDDRVLIEKFIAGPCHIEVQVFGDRHANVIHLYERDCSLQRRHQKVIEEAPAPGMTPEVRAAMTEAAVRAAKAVDYVNAGTVEFIVDGSGVLRPDGFWFMEMNTRLQVEHPVTEAVTGLDLVELQLRVAAGERLPPQDAISLCGHAFEARLYAEDPAAGFLPSVGRLHIARLDSGDDRIDAAVTQGDTVSPHYDPMIAKLIASGADRSEARTRLAALVGRTAVYGVATNAGFLKRCIDHPDFAAGGIDTQFLGREGEALVAPSDEAIETAVAAAALVALDVGAASSPPADAWRDPWAHVDGFRLNASPRRRISLAWHDQRFDVGVEIHAGGLRCSVGERTLETNTWAVQPTPVEPGGFGRVALRVAGADHAFDVVRLDQAIVLFRDGWTFAFTPPHPEAAAEALDAGDEIKAPMPGKVIALSARPGARVRKGEALLVLEAMKMEHALSAPRDGVVDWVGVGEGAQVREGDALVRLAEVD